jgi:hypothetical protein
VPRSQHYLFVLRVLLLLSSSSTRQVVDSTRITNIRPSHSSNPTLVLSRVAIANETQLRTCRRTSKSHHPTLVATKDKNKNNLTNHHRSPQLASKLTTMAKERRTRHPSDPSDTNASNASKASKASSAPSPPLPPRRSTRLAGLVRNLPSPSR